MRHFLMTKWFVLVHRLGTDVGNNETETDVTKNRNVFIMSRVVIYSVVTFKQCHLHLYPGRYQKITQLQYHT